MVKAYEFFLLNPKSTEIVADIDKFAPVSARDRKDLFDGIIKQEEFENWEVNHSYTIQRGNYNIEKIIEFITTNFHLLFENQTIDLKMNINQYRVECFTNVNFAITYYAETCVFQLLGFGSQSSVREIPGQRSVEFIIFNEN